MHIAVGIPNSFTGMLNKSWEIIKANSGLAFVVKLRDLGYHEGLEGFDSLIIFFSIGGREDEKIVLRRVKFN